MSARKTVLFGSLVLLAILALLLLRNCGKTGDESPFDYFRAKAVELGRDPARVAKFVSDEVKSLPYKGNVKGALATLWEGAGSPEEKAALSEALLAHCPGGKPPAPVSGLAVTVTHRGAQETVVYEGPIGDLVGDVHSVETVAPGKTRVTLRARPPVVKELEAGSEREEIVFRVQRPGEDKPLEVVRELWHKDNLIGPVSAIPEDRHDFVVLPCRVGKFVREKEEELLKARGRDKSEEAKGYLALLDYCLRSDLALADLERDLKIRARFDIPRILILSRAKVPDLPDGVMALDLRLNRVTFDGGDKADSYLAAQVRSFVESGLEHHFLSELTRQPCTSAYDVFNKLNDDYPNSYDRRLALIGASLAALGDNGRGTFRARKDGPTVTVKKEGDRFVLSGARIKESIAKELKLGDSYGKPEDAALAVELALMSTDAPPNYVIEVVELSRGDDSLVAEGARFVFRWGEGEGRTDQEIVVESCSGDLDLRWRVQSGVRPARGRRVIARAALNESMSHNPWYLTGEDRAEDATSFCVSRQVFQELRGGRSVAMSLQGAYGPEQEQTGPRPVAWKGQVTRTGEGVHRTLINGRQEEIPVIRVKIGDAEIAILDDPRFPVGMADKITEIRTSIRARLVDESGLGIPGAVVGIPGGRGGTTGPDGRFILPPSTGKMKLTVTRGGKTLGEPEVDLTAPGRADVLVTVPRLRTELLFITKANARDLDSLGLSAQAKRHVDRFVNAGYQVVIPSRRVEVDGVDVIAYYAHDLATGDIIGVTEDGLNGTSAAWGRALASLARDLAKAKGKLTPFAHVHAMRGAIVAWWIYSKERVGGLEHEEAIKKMLDEMDYWEKSTNLLTGLGEVPGARLAMKTAMKSAGLGGLTGSGAAAAFKIGYLGATAFLERKLEGP